MREKLYESIEAAFETLDIQLKKRLSLSDSHNIPESVTNHFLKVEDTEGATYLVRINGKLWPPFSREDERYNLNVLKENKIESKVLYNDIYRGFQICRFGDKKFQTIPTKEHDYSYFLMCFARALRQVHNLFEFKGSYPVHKTIYYSYQRLPKTARSELIKMYSFMMSLMKVLADDRENYVSSHNDLLPSSIYFEDNAITFVDWEYSAENHRVYDLALFSTKSNLSPLEEDALLAHYDPNAELDIAYYFAMMKPVVQFLLLTWDLATGKVASALIPQLMSSMQQVVYNQSARSLVSEAQLGLFFHRERRTAQVEDQITHNRKWF